MDDWKAIEAICRRGWDAPNEVDLERASWFVEDPQSIRRDVWTAAAYGEGLAVRRLLAADPALATQPGGPWNWTPILYASFSAAHELVGRGDAVIEVVAALLEYGASSADAYEVEPGRFSALYGALAVNGHLDRARLLVAAGAPGSDGQSLYSAVESFNIDHLDLLGRAGLDPEDVSYCLLHAIDMLWDTGVSWLLNHGAATTATHSIADETCLHWAIKRAAGVQTIELLLDHGADPNAKTKDGRAALLPLLGTTPLDYALRLGRPDIVEILESRGAIRREATPEEAFIYAAAAGDEDEIQDLTSDDPDLMAKLPAEDRGLVPFLAHQGALPGVTLLCELGFDVNTTSWMGLTALHWAALRGDDEMTRTLLVYGAVMVDVGGYFGTPMDCTAHAWWQGDHAAVADLLAFAPYAGAEEDPATLPQEPAPGPAAADPEPSSMPRREPPRSDDMLAAAFDPTDDPRAGEDEDPTEEASRAFLAHQQPVALKVGEPPSKDCAVPAGGEELAVPQETD